MYRKIYVSALFLLISSAVCFAQNDILIKKKSSFRIPGMPAMAGLGDLENRPLTVYLKGTRMRTDLEYKKRKMMGGKETVTQTMILQCDKQRRVQFNSKSKKYYTDLLSGDSSEASKKAEKGGIVTLSGNVTDTGERAALFGFQARRLRQTLTLTPGANSCLKQAVKIETDGWYADIPEFSCPIKRDPQEFKLDQNCFDDVDYQVKGAVTGVPLKEIKTITVDGKSMQIVEEVVEVTKTTLKDEFFEPPANYKAANSLKEVEEDDSSEDNTANRQEPLPVVTTDSKLALPTGGLEKTSLGAKKAGVVRIGIARPAVTMPDSKKDASLANELAKAVSAYLAENLKAEKVETVEFESVAPESEAKQKDCDYVFYTTITQKRAGGMFGGLLPTMPSMPGGGGGPNTNPINAPTEAGRAMQSLMLQYTRAKDEFTFDYKVAAPNAAPLAQAANKIKAKQYGEDVLSQQIKDAAIAVLGKIAN